MAKFEIYDNDDLLSEDTQSLTSECPFCKKDISFSLNDIDTKIICPHCKAEIELESN